MGWFDTPDESAAAVEEALKHSKSRALPVTAHSHTEAAYIAGFRKRGLIMLGVYLGLVGLILLGLVLDGGQESRSILLVAAPFSLLGGLAIYVAVRMRMRKYGQYRDPGLAVDVGADGIIVRGSAGDHGLRWQEIDARVNWLQVKGNSYFVGLWVESPLGLVDLREETYRDGRIAAALIVRGKHDDYHARQRAKVERIG